MKLNEKAYNFAKKLLKLYTTKPTEGNTTKLEETAKDEKRIIGKTDYKKYEDLAHKIELEEAINDPKTKEALKMGCNNDLRKERQLLEKPNKDKLEAARMFKLEGDDYLKAKSWNEALNAYEKGLLQLFYTFGEDPEEDKKVDAIKATINMNMSMCKLNLEKYEDAIGYCLEALRIDKANLKALYRVAFGYFKLEKFDESKKYIDQALKIDESNQDFKSLLDKIKSREREIEENSRKLFKKLGKI